MCSGEYIIMPCLSSLLSSLLSCQVWDLEYLAKVREQECHDKGVKCIDVNKDVILTGSYDAMFKVGPLLMVGNMSLMPLLLRCGGRVTGAVSRPSRATVTVSGTSSCMGALWSVDSRHPLFITPGS